MQPSEEKSEQDFGSYFCERVEIDRGVIVLQAALVTASLDALSLLTGRSAESLQRQMLSVAADIARTLPKEEMDRVVGVWCVPTPKKKKDATTIE